MFTPFRVDPLVESETDWFAPPIETDRKPVRPLPLIDEPAASRRDAVPEMVPV